jgi:hypothetical protein
MTTMLFVGLMALAAFLVLSTIWMARGGSHPHSRTRVPFAWVTLAGALFLGIYSISSYLGLGGTPQTIAVAAPVSTASADELARLRAALTAAKTEVEAKQKRVDLLDAEKAKALADAQKLEQQQSTHLTSVLGSIYGVQSQTSKETGEPAGTMPSNITSLTNVDKYNVIERELATLRRLLELTAKNRKATPDEMAELMQLKDKLNTQMNTPNYEVSVYPDPELVKGRRGKYYVIDIKDADKGAKYFFDGGKYTISTRQEQFRTSLNSFVKDVLEKMQGRVEYQLMVRGSADSKPWRGQFETGHEYKTLKYLKSIGPDKYVNEVSDVQLDRSLNNGDLPNLRAAFLQKVVGSVYPVKEPVILQGVVSDKVNTGDRNAELILFVNW